MKNKLVLTSVMVTVLMAFAPSAQAQEPMEQVVERGLQRAHSQSLILAEALKDKEGALVSSSRRCPSCWPTTPRAVMEEPTSA